MNHLISRSRLLRTVFFGSFLFALQSALVAYINSTFLSQFISERFVGFVFTGGALLTLVSLVFMPRLIRIFGNRRVLLVILIANFLALIEMVHQSSPHAVIVAFVAYLLTNNLAIVTFDVFIEHLVEEKSTGKLRGAYLSIVNIAWVLSPLLAAFFIARGGFTLIYTSSLILVFLTYFSMSTFIRGFTDGIYEREHFFRTIGRLFKNRSLTIITGINFIIQFFYAWMIIYTPIYLTQHIGLSWESLGVIFTVMLLPFVLIPYPLGRIADKKFGEKELLIVGLFVMGASTLALSIPKAPVILVWMAILLMTRIGAATAESMVEVFFFKHVGPKDTGLISLFRDMSPFAFVVAPLLGTLILNVSSYHILFITLGVIVLIGAILALRLKDTR